MAINIGIIAEHRGTQLGPDYTMINKVAASPFDGLLTTVEIWAEVALEGCKVGSFYGIDRNLQCRDFAIIGAVPADSVQTFPDLEIAVLAGDLIGMYFTVGKISEDIFGQDGLYYESGDQFETGEIYYSYGAAWGISLGGLVEGAPPAPAGHSRAFVIG
ncbi:hypothetical protein ES708_28736 [subsurface metagenome]